MQRALNPGLRPLARVLDAVALTLTYLLIFEAREALVSWWPYDLFPDVQTFVRDLPQTRHLMVLGAVIPAWLFGLHYAESYDNLHSVRTNQLLVRALKGCAIGMGTTLLFLFAVREIGHVSRSVFTGFALSSYPVILLNRYLVVRWLQERHRRGLDLRNMLVVGTTTQALPFIRALERNQRWGVRVLGVVHPDHYDQTETSGASYKVLGRVRELPRLLEELPVDQVYVSGQTWEVERLRAIADSCEELGVEFTMDANFLGLQVAQASLRDYEGNPVLSFSSTPNGAEAMAIKRLMDIVLSALALLALLPVFAVVAALIKLDDPGGPVLFGQVRSGLYGRTFKMWKFRSMVANAEALRAQLEQKNERDGPVFKITGDPRITRIGRFIRKTSIDELPQFWNVLVGEMSLVGPRPPIPAEVEKYERWQRRRLSMRPGITCIWQVSGRSDNVDFRTWMLQDLEYIDNWSLLLDLKLLLRTVPVVLLGHGAK